MRRITGWGIAALLAVSTTACSISGTLGGTAPTAPVPSSASDTGFPSADPGASTTAAGPGVTLSQADAATVLKVYQDTNNRANAAMDPAKIAGYESGAAVIEDQATCKYTLGETQDKIDQFKTPITFTDKRYLIPVAKAYPRWFAATVTAVSKGSPNLSWLVVFAQKSAGAPWLNTLTVIQSLGVSWPDFALDDAGHLKAAPDAATLLFDPAKLPAADAAMLQTGTVAAPFTSDDPTSHETGWVSHEQSAAASAATTTTVTPDASAPPIALPTADGGVLVLYATRISLRISGPGTTFRFGGGEKALFGADSVAGGYTAEALFSVAALDPAGQGGQIQKIADYGGIVALHK